MVIIYHPQELPQLTDDAGPWEVLEWKDFLWEGKDAGGRHPVTNEVHRLDPLERIWMDGF